MMRIHPLLAPVAALLLLAGCATKPPPMDYSAFKLAKPAGLLVLPPLNESADVKGTPSMWVNATRPLAEAGYYVFPVTLVDETLRQNGIQSATDAHAIAADKLRDYFGADAAVYITVKNYGTKYAVLASETVVQAEAKVVDLRTGVVLWSGKAQATSAEMQQQQQAGLVGILVLALVKQIAGTAADAAFDFGGTASERLFATETYNGMLPGPRSPNYGKDLPRQ